jgi:non-ribosomal peptide synthetase component E (peptide arylation enzyme)
VALGDEGSLVVDGRESDQVAAPGEKIVNLARGQNFVITLLKFVS